MSFAIPFRRVASRCGFQSHGRQLSVWSDSRPGFLCHTIPARSPLSLTHQSRSASNKTKDSGESAAENPVLAASRRLPKAKPAAEKPVLGSLGSSSIFAAHSAQHGSTASDALQAVVVGGRERDAARLARVLDVNPGGRERWQRKKVIQLVRRGGRLSKEQYLKRTERSITVRSHEMKTSVKKLGKLARQIAGKTVDDAITQMRFSKKKVATEVLKQLEQARDEAAVSRGMGWGTMSGETDPAAKPVDIQLKDGKRHTVTNRNQIYIDQAWVGRAKFGRLIDHRARGKVNIMMTPWTSLSVQLKEEHTRVREWEEREAKRRKKLVDKVWTHLPDRPVQWQRQWYTF